MGIYRSIAELVGHTPLLALHSLGTEQALQAVLLAKLEYFNPAGSAKARLCHHRAHQRQYRYCAGCHRHSAGVSGDPHHAGHHEHGAPEPAAGLWRGADPH